MEVGDLVETVCRSTKATTVAQVLEIRSTAYGWSELVLLCSCGYYYNGSTLRNKNVKEVK
jgi:hypothetical protein